MAAIHSFLSNREDQATNTPSVPSVSRVLSILELIAGTRRGLSLSELSRRLGLPKSSCHCLVVTLERRNYLFRNPATNRYVIGPKVFELGESALNGITLRDQAAPFLSALMETTRLTVHLAIPDHDCAVIIDKVPGPGMLQLATWIGKRFDLHCTGVGKALLAHLPEEDFNRIVRGNGLTRYNENTIVSFKRLSIEAELIRARGYAIEDEEGEIGFRCLGAPIWDRKQTAVAAVSIAGSTVQINETNLDSLGRTLRRVADQISTVLGSPLTGRGPGDAGEQLLAK